LRHPAIGEFAHLELDFVGLAVVALRELPVQRLGSRSVDDCGSQSCLPATNAKRGPDAVVLGSFDDQRVSRLPQRFTRGDRVTDIANTSAALCRFR
jgi:hypothetical protein